ncbi:MAG: hypothetical protein WCV86_05435 [Patescibacteria group bacterium]|jgi:hypothetical protein
MWFTNFQGRPDEWTPAHGYSELFKETVRLIREQFYLERVKTGEDRNRSGQWREYTLQGETVRVSVARFRYSEVGIMGGSLSPIFRLEVVMQRLITPEATWTDEDYWAELPPEESAPWWLAMLAEWFPNSDWVNEKMIPYTRMRNVRRTRQVKVQPESTEPKWEVFFRNPMMIVFPEAFPTEPPRFRVDTNPYKEVGASHDHHLFNDGWMCILAGRKDWDVTRDSILSGLNAALDWCVLHFKRYGW